MPGLAEAIEGYAQDILTRIVNVNWGGGVFVSGGGTIRYIKMSGSKPSWIDLGGLGFSSIGTVHASSYAKIGADETPVFLLGGNDFGGTDGHVDNGLIMASSDGKQWTRVLTVEPGNPDSFSNASLLGIVWDDQARCFYAGGHVFRVLGAGKEQDEDLLFQSFNGRAWSQIGREIWQSTPIGHAAGLLAKHCNERVKDSFGNGVPDGVYGYDKGNDILIAPTVRPAINYNNGVIRAHPVTTVAITTIEGTSTADVGIPVNCVAYAGGVWLAAGGVSPANAPMSSYSTDAGATWTTITVEPEQDPEPILTICAGAPA